MELNGLNFIGNRRSGNGQTTFQAVNPAGNEKLGPLFHEASIDEINEAVSKAETAFQEYSRKSGEEKAGFLEAVADEIAALGNTLIERCRLETGLPEGRLTGERQRTTNQLRLFAGLLREGSWVDARIDTFDGKPDIRSMQMALGPVGIFGASNFPLAFSVAGGDTASALAAGCSVVVKAHPAHPGTCELVGSAILKAIQKTGMPDGTFSMVHGVSNEVGMAIVNHPLIKAVGFTGSFRGGKALYDAAVRRMEPIPVYAEMGSTNPVFILPGALKDKSNEIAEGLVGSVTLGNGQFCTNPGLVVLEKSRESDQFQKAVAENLRRQVTGPMLTSGIHSAYEKGIKRMKDREGVQVLAQGEDNSTGNAGIPQFLMVGSSRFLSDKSLEKEVFGPSTLNIVADDKEDLINVAQNLEGHLTATLFGTEEDLQNYRELVSILKRKAGRLIFNGFPTGVEVCHSMIHGGPFPATTDSRTTSVGTSAITRFTRPVCLQNFPDSRLPDELKKNNPLKIWRLENGEKKR